MNTGLTIGAFAKSVGVRADTIRYYERHGLLADPGRTAAGYRIYDARDVERVRFIRKGKHLGFTLKEIGTLLSLHSSDTARAADVLDITQRKIAEFKSQISDLSQIEAALQRLADECPVNAPATDCPILAHLAALPERQGERED